ncbi:MAG: hypothetical protein OXF05_04155 [Hyphomicrobiales bacterium]|nr:hypothetical protein [Hyphomicrobiales bacterium]MCY4038599.1 hypothetical protein [Hyphomicrobiales bacterium]
MTMPRRSLTPKRIVVALRSHSEADIAVNAATILAQALRAELCGLFVEQESVLQSSGLPFAQVVGMRRGAQVSRENMLAAFEQDALACRRLLSSRAERARVAWRFDRVRGESYEIFFNEPKERAAEREDILLLQESYGGGSVREIIAHARGAAERFGGMILLGPWRRRHAGPVVAVIENIGTEGGMDAGDADERILDLAIRIAHEQGSRLLVFVVGETHAEAEEALRQAQARLPGGESLEGYAFLSDAVGEVCHGLAVSEPSFVLLDVEGVLFRDDARAERLLRSARSPVALLKSRD